MKKVLSALASGEKGVIDRLETSEEASLKFMELGLFPGEPVVFLRQAPLGGPIEIELMGYRLCIRKEDGDRIFVECGPNT
ncbi:MAG: FeoA family protein [Elusimicrobiota bacterium]|jgi:ferrous iron transport protein A